MQVILNYIDLFEFLHSVGKLNTSFPILDPMGKAKKYFHDSALWYEFTRNLYDTLLDYKVQNNLNKYESDVAKLIKELTIPDFEKLNVNETSMKEFVQRIGGSIDPRVENLTVNAIGMQRMSSMLNETMGGIFEHTCLSDTLTVYARSLKLSDILKIPCIGTSKKINIFVLNKLFFDAKEEIRWNEKDLSILSPTWDGKLREPPNANDGTSNSMTGGKGKAGNSGTSSGNFLGIGDKFINANSLKIYLNGGKGSTGQHGGKGMQQFSEQILFPRGLCIQNYLK